MSSNIVCIAKAAKAVGVSISTLRRWEYLGKLVPSRTVGGHRRYNLQDIKKLAREFAPTEEKITVAYARVSSADQAADLERQKNVLELYCASKGWNFKLISDLGSGINYKKKGLKELITSILNDEVGRLVVTHKDRLLRFGAELVFSICTAKGVSVEIINNSSESSFEDDLTKDVLEIITVFSAKLYGSRSHKNKKLLEKLQETATEYANIP